MVSDDDFESLTEFLGQYGPNFEDVSLGDFLGQYAEAAGVDPYGPGSNWGADTLSAMGLSNDTNIASLKPSDWSRLLTTLRGLGGRAVDFATSPQGIMSLIGAAANYADRQRPSGGGTTMAYQGPAELKRKIVQGPYGPIAEYEGVGGGSPDYTRFAAPTVRESAPAPRTPTGQTAQQKADLYKFMRDSIGMSDAQIRQFANYSYGDQKDSDWQELLRIVGGNAPVAAPKTTAPVTAPVAAPVTSTPGTKPRSDMGFTRDPNAAGASVIVPWYNKKTGQTYMASDTAWEPPSADWVQGEEGFQIEEDPFLTALQETMGQSSSTATPLRAAVDPTAPTFRQYNLSQVASDFLNRQNAATGNPWEYDYRTKTYSRQGSAGPETLSYDDVMRMSNQDKVQYDIALSESRRPMRDPQEQARLDAYMKQALPNLLEDANRTGTYTPITNFLVKYGITEADINRAFGPGGLGPEFNAKVQSDAINIPVIGVGGGAFAYDRSMATAAGPNAAFTKFSVPDYITQAYGLLGKTEQKTAGQVPSWLERYRSPSVGPEDLDRAKQTAAEFGRVYGREITPYELDDLMGTARANIVHNLGLDPKNRANYVSAIAPAKEETLRKILRSVETGVGGHLTQADMVSLGLGQYKNLILSSQEALEALNSGNPDQYIQQRARTRGLQSVVPPKTRVFGEVAGLKLTAPEREPTSKSLGGVGIGSLPDLIQYYNLNDEELRQLEQLMRSSGDEQYATQINQLRTGTLPPPSWGHAAWQNQNTADFFGVTGTPEAQNYIYQGAFRPLIEQASALNKIGYRPGMGLAAGPEKPTAQQMAAAVVGTPFATPPASQPAAPRDLRSLLPSDWGSITDPSKKIDWFNEKKATEAELMAAGVKPEEIAWMRQNKLGTYAGGGPVRMEDGGFVMTKRAVDGAGGPRGIQQLVPGARMIRGPGHGTSDSIPAYIQGRNGRTPARLSNGEAYVPPGHDTDKLYALMKSLERNA